MLEEQIQMVDLHGQYLRFKEEIDEAMQAVIDSCAFINGPQVKFFAGHLADYLQVPYVIPCANGTDALQIALMALELQPGDDSAGIYLYSGSRGCRFVRVDARVGGCRSLYL